MTGDECRQMLTAAMVPNTSDDLPDPETPVNTVSRRLGIWTLTSFRLFSRAPSTRIKSWLSAFVDSPSPRLRRAGWLEEAMFAIMLSRITRLTGSSLRGRDLHTLSCFKARAKRKRQSSWPCLCAQDLLESAPEVPCSGQHL
jgi:hypothetical protein